MYPLFFNEIYKPYLWGGRRFEQMLGKKLPREGNYAESWEISARQRDNSIVTNGHLKGGGLIELVQTYTADLLGTKVIARYGANFPLLIKFLDVDQPLSVQVHPNDLAAQQLENEPFGKTEGWYIVHSESYGRIIYGLKKDTTEEKLFDALSSDPTEYLMYHEVTKGDFFLLKAGTVHAALAGLIIYEVQQNSNITYRLFDWNRMDRNGQSRPLHIANALKVIDYSIQSPPPTGEWQRETGGKFRLLTTNQYFTMIERAIDDKHIFECDGDTFRTVTIVEGCGVLRHKNNSWELSKGKSFLLPASLTDVICEGDIHFIESYMN